MTTHGENNVVFLTTIFRWFGASCSRSPVEILVIWLTVFACFLTLGLYEHSLIPSFKELDSDGVSAYKKEVYVQYISVVLYLCLSVFIEAYSSISKFMFGVV